MKKFLTCIAAVLSLTLCIAGLSACDDKTAEHEHTLVEHTAVAPTCTEPGNKHYWGCSDCGKNFTGVDATEEIAVVTTPATGHTEVVISGTPATCTTAGLTDGKKCSVCNETLVEQKTIDALGHTYVKTCNWTGSDEDGYTAATMVFTCSVCDVAAEEVAATVTSKTTDSTCAEAGEILYTATATFGGKEYTETKSVELKSTGHTCTKVDAVAPSCEGNGTIEHWHCSVCGKNFTGEDATEEIAVVTTPATGHTEVVISGTPATCTAAGLTDGKKCSVCNETLVEQKTIAALGHTYVKTCNWTGSDEDGYTAATMVFTCSVCDVAAEEVAAAVTSKTTDSTCTQKGNITYTATVTFKGEQYTDQKVIEAELAEHDWVATWSMDDKDHWHGCANCSERKDSAKHTGGTATSEKRAECDVCGAEYGKLLPAYNGGELILEAEEAELTGSCYAQGTFVGGIAANDTITFTFYSQSENKVELLLAIANGNNSIDKSFIVTINGEESFNIGAETSGSGQWTTFVDRHVAYLTLNANIQYTVKFDVYNANGVNLDYLKIIPWDGTVPEPPAPPEEELTAYNGTELILQAEEAELSGCNVQGNFVGGLSAGGSLTFEFKSDVDQDVELILSFANGGAAIEKSLRVIINDDDPFTFDADAIQSGQWTLCEERTVAGYKLKADTKYTVKFVVLDAGGRVNVDYFKIVPWTDGEVVLPTPEELPAYTGEAALVLQAGSDASIKGDHNLSSGFVGGLMTGSELTFKFRSSVSGKVELVLNAATSAENITFSVTLNEESLSPVTINAVGSGVDCLVLETELEADKNYTVVFTAGEAVRNNVSVYSFKVIPYVAYTAGGTLTYGAADVTPLNGCDHQSHSAGWGGHIIGNINQPGRGVMITLNSQEGINVHLSVYTDGNSGSEVTFEVLVNGESAGTCTYTANGWANFTEVRDAGNIALEEGKNTIEIRVTSGAMNFSHLVISPVVTDTEEPEVE